MQLSKNRITGGRKKGCFCCEDEGRKRSINGVPIGLGRASGGGEKRKFMRRKLAKKPRKENRGSYTAPNHTKSFSGSDGSTSMEGIGKSDQRGEERKKPNKSAQNTQA